CWRGGRSRDPGQEAALILLAAFLGGTARAGPDAEDEPPPEETPWWLGLPVASVQFSAPEGGLPEESLSPLLRVTEGLPLDPHLVGLDLTALFQVSEFSAVEAEIEPWVLDDPATDAPVPAVNVTYVVHPAPRITALKATGSHKHFRTQELLAE